MAKNILVIVESPAKAQTIEKYLGKGYSVAASVGHLIDLPKSRLGIDVTHDFEPEYITVRGKAPILKDLRQHSKKADEVLLASDNDREGEAISFHIRNALLQKNPDLTIRRIVFNEITPEAIRAAVKQPGDIDLAKVRAQKARRVLDRLVGYNLSPLLWSKVKNGLSAGRVQSVALRLVCEREKEVESFVPAEYWSLDAKLQKGKRAFVAALVEFQGEKPELKSEQQVVAITDSLQGATFVVGALHTSEKEVRPRAPFTTSTLQQAAANRLGFTSRKTMQIAQQLYQGVDLGSSRVGLITYMRTDSTRVSEAALEDVRTFIGAEFSAGLPPQPNAYSTKKGAQDAHEAVRPTYVRNTPDEVKAHLTKDQAKLYSIIWERFVASQMLPERLATTSVDILAGAARFRVSSTKSVQLGYQAALKLLAAKEKRVVLPSVSEGDEVDFQEFAPEQHFTTGPARFTDASIVKTLEEQGIGRPATYAPIISTLLDRYYVVRRTRALQPTLLGRLINDLLTECFPEVIDVAFTSAMEEQLDEVEENRAEWVEVVRSFYGPFKSQVDHVNDTLESIKGIMDEPTDHVCERCGRPMVKKLGKYGFFIACTGFPECRSTKPVPLAKCPRPECDGHLVARKRQGRGREFYGCTNFPECDFVVYQRPTEHDCPKCHWFLAEREERQQSSRLICVNPECDFEGMDAPEPPHEPAISVPLRLSGLATKAAASAAEPAGNGSGHQLQPAAGAGADEQSESS
jgi:DNA topoisomerase-1